MIDNMPTNIMLANLEGIIISANPASIATLKKIQHLLPVKAEEVVGKSYDLFHKNPSHQRNLLADSRNLPHNTVISVGEEKLDLLVSPIFDADSKYSGSMLTWTVVTDKYKMEAQVRESKERLESSVLSLVNSTNLSIKDLESSFVAISTATEELISSIAEISHNTREAAETTKKAVENTNMAEEKVSLLGARSLEIAEITKLITNIASQTNLLALNATIEAARAGEAGKGFAVVANEIKQLASETDSATRDISDKILAIQSDTKVVTSAFETINGLISDINSVVTTISSAIEEQNAVTSEIGSNMNVAKDKVVLVSSNVKAIEGNYSGLKA
jgi:methyl-accepting chemotaxis protein